MATLFLGRFGVTEERIKKMNVPELDSWIKSASLLSGIPLKSDKPERVQTHQEGNTITTKETIVSYRKKAKNGG